MRVWTDQGTKPARSIQAAAAVLGLPEEEVIRLVQAGELPLRTGATILDEDLQAYLRK